MKMAKISNPDKSTKEIINFSEAKNEAKSALEKILGDISRTSAMKQIIIGVSSGWITGYIAMRVGRPTAFALGSGIILLQIANKKGYIKVNWDKVNRKFDAVTDTVEQAVTGQQPTIIDKAERFVDRNITRAENTLKKKGQTAKRWYSQILGNGNVGLKEVHIFVISFVAGIAIGIGSS